MGAVLGEILASAVGVAISPLPIIALAMVFFSSKPKANSIAFTLGWVIPMIVMEAIFFGANKGVSAGQPQHKSAAVSFILGALLLYLAYRTYIHRPRGDTKPESPKWMAKLETATPVTSFIVSLGLITVGNPKNIAFAAQSSTIIVSSKLPLAQQIILGVVWCIIGALPAIIPTVWYLLRGEELRPKLQDARDWLLAHNATIMYLLFLLLGVQSIGQGIERLG